MKITMLTTLCGPDGNAFPGHVYDLRDKPMVDSLLAVRSARKFDAEKDAKKPVEHLAVGRQEPQK